MMDERDAYLQFIMDKDQLAEVWSALGNDGQKVALLDTLISEADGLMDVENFDAFLEDLVDKRVDGILAYLRAYGEAVTRCTKDWDLLNFLNNNNL